MPLMTRFHRCAGVAPAAAALALALPANAADLAVKAPPPVPDADAWTGLYGGPNFGFALTREQATTPLGGGQPSPAGAIGGGQIGYNVQVAPSWLIGIEGDFEATSVQAMTNVVTPPPEERSARWPSPVTTNGTPRRPAGSATSQDRGWSMPKAAAPL